MTKVTPTSSASPVEPWLVTTTARRALNRQRYRGYNRLIPDDQRDLLSVISEEMQFGRTNPAFVEQCRGALALIIANPTWVPGSLSNDELEDEIAFWRSAERALGFLGIKSIGAVLTGKAQGLLKAAGEAIEKAAAGSGLRRGQIGSMSKLHSERAGG